MSGQGSFVPTEDFYPRPLRGGRRRSGCISQLTRRFLSTPSARRATDLGQGNSPARGISIHALCEEGDGALVRTSPLKSYFYPRPLRGGRLQQTPYVGYPYYISIHALCEEGDTLWLAGSPVYSDFYPRPLRGGRPTPPERNTRDWLISIHALCEEGDEHNSHWEAGAKQFLSTPSARRATEQRKRQHYD